MVTMNIGGLQDAEGGAADRSMLAGMKSSFTEIASPVAMFGSVPNAERAAAALESAARTMLEELEKAGHTVDEIRQSAAAAAGIGEDSDAEAGRTLSRAHAEAVAAFDSSMTSYHPFGMDGRPGGT